MVNQLSRLSRMVMATGAFFLIWILAVLYEPNEYLQLGLCMVWFLHFSYTITEHWRVCILKHSRRDWIRYTIILCITLAIIIGFFMWRQEAYYARYYS